MRLQARDKLLLIRHWPWMTKVPFFLTCMQEPPRKMTRPNQTGKLHKTGFYDEIVEILVNKSPANLVPDTPAPKPAILLDKTGQVSIYRDLGLWASAHAVFICRLV